MSDKKVRKKVAIDNSAEVDQLLKSNSLLQQTNELYLLQIQQLQEELEHFYIKCKEYESRGGQLSGTSSNRGEDTDSIQGSVKVTVTDKYEEDGYLDLHLQIDNCALGRSLTKDRLKCKLVLNNGVVGLEFRKSEATCEDSIKYWPVDMVDEYGQYFLFIPSADGALRSQQDDLFFKIPTADKYLLLAVINAIYNSFIEGSVACDGKLTDVELILWRKVAIDLFDQSTKLKNSLTVNAFEFQEELNLDGYRHIWVNAKDLSYKEKVFNSFPFKVISVFEGKKEKLYLEFRQISGQCFPFESWSPLKSDEFGGKILLNIAISRNKVRLQSSDFISDNDWLLVETLLQKIPVFFESLLNSEGETNDLDRNFWSAKILSFGNRKIFVNKKKTIAL